MMAILQALRRQRLPESSKEALKGAMDFGIKVQAFGDRRRIKSTFNTQSVQAYLRDSHFKRSTAVDILLTFCLSWALHMAGGLLDFVWVFMRDEDSMEVWDFNVPL
jgi:hypothetical protein